MEQEEATTNPNKDIQDEDLEIELTTENMTEDIVENFAKQLDEVMRIEDDVSCIDSESDEDEMFGYQQLPQDEDMDNEDQLQSDKEEEEEEIEKGPLVIDIEPESRLDEETSDLIKSIMTNIQLSEKAVPEWAKKIPEKAWLPATRK